MIIKVCPPLCLNEHGHDFVVEKYDDRGGWLECRFCGMRNIRLIMGVKLSGGEI